MSEPMQASFLLSGFVIDRRLLPNRRRSGWTDGRLRRAQRADVATMLRPQLAEMGVAFEANTRLACRLSVGWPRERDVNGKLRRWPIPDGDALNSACKGLFDGVADAIGVDDRHFAVGAPKQMYDPDDRGWVAIELSVLPA